MQRANILASSLSSVSSYATVRLSITRGCTLTTSSCTNISHCRFLSNSSPQSISRIQPSFQTMRYSSSTTSGAGSGGTKKQKPKKRFGSSLAARALVATATVSTTYAAYYGFSSITGVNGDDTAGNGAYKPETKKDETYGIEYVGFDSYKGIELDDGTGVATKEEKAASAEVVARALEAAGLDETGMMKGIESSEEFMTLHPKHAHRKVVEGAYMTCPVYGCPFLPLDVHYDEDVKSKLETMRKEPPAAAAAAEGGLKEDLPHLLHSSGSDHAATLTLIGYKGGSLDDQINQDRALALAPYSYWNINGSSATKQPVARLIGAFDGHAKFGEKVSEYVAKTLPALLGSKLAEYDAKVASSDADVDEEQTVHDIGKILQDTFLELDATSPADPSGGCTSSAVLQIGTKIYIANAGDSRSFIAVHITPPEGSDEEPSTKLVFATREDKPHLTTERNRVEHMGGTVYLPNGFLESGKGTTRVLYKDPTTGSTSGLAMSRSIGDWDAGEVGVIPDPLIDVLDIEEIKKRVLENLNESCKDGTKEVEIDPASGESKPSNGQCVTYTEKDLKIFAVSATDGLCDYLPEQAIVNHIAKGLYDIPTDPTGEDAGSKDEPKPSNPLLVCEDLIYAAAQGWQEDKGGRYRDDIAIAVADLGVE